MTENEPPPIDSPLMLARVAWTVSRVSKRPAMEMLDLWATVCGVEHGSEAFDLAAEMMGMPYCRALDLYVDPATKARAEALHFTEAHRALM